MQHDVVTQARGAVDADQDAIFDGGAEAHGQAVGARARALVVGPRVRDQTSALPKDVGGASCREERRRGGGGEGYSLDLREEKGGYYILDHTCN